MAKEQNLNESTYHGLVLSCHMVLDKNTKSISSLILALLLDRDVNLNPVENGELEGLQIGDNFAPFVLNHTRLVLDEKWALAALAQRIQPGCGLYLSGIVENDCHLTMDTNKEARSSVQVMNSTHPKILKLHSQFSSLLTEQLTA